MLLPSLLALSFLTFLVIRESVFKVPVPIRPLRGDVTDTDIYLYWNPVRGEEVSYHAQLAADRPDFTNPLYEWGEEHNWERARVRTGQLRVARRRALSPGNAYFWRVRSVVDGRPRPWSRSIPFRTREEPEVRAELKLEITEAVSHPEGVRVAGICDLPDNMVIVSQVIDREGGVSARALRFLRGGRFEEDFRREFAEDEAFRARVSLKPPPFLEYPLSETLGDRGEKLPGMAVVSGRLITGLVLEVSLPAGAGSSGRERAGVADEGYFLEAECAVVSENEIAIEGVTSLPDGSRLSAAAFFGRRRVSLINNAIRAGGGRLRGTLRPRDEGFDFTAAPLRVVVLIDPAFQEADVLGLIGPAGENLAADADDSPWIYYNLMAEEEIAPRPGRGR